MGHTGGSAEISCKVIILFGHREIIDAIFFRAKTSNLQDKTLLEF